jgi:hypothetical protein
MQPDARSQRRICEALKAPRFHIQALDDFQSVISPDQGFKSDWLIPGESLVSILWKFACANGLPGEALMRLMCPDVDPLAG